MTIKEIKMPKNYSKCNMTTYKNHIRQKVRYRRMTIDEVDMFQLGYNKAIDDIKEKLMQNGFIYTQHALDVFNEIAEQLKAGEENAN